MNNNQKRAIDIALKGHNLLLLGSAGTGKSFVILEIAKRLSRAGKCVKITCSTGIACSVFGQEKACTIHQFTGISDGRFGADEIVNVIKDNRRYDYVVENLRQVDTLIVDEVSMISQKVFETINAVCCMKDTSSVFGSIQVIFCGDFFQLPPVANRHYSDNGKYCFESQLFNTVFPHRVVLTVNIRQRDEDLVKAVNEIYSGNLSPESEHFIRNCNGSLDLPPGQRRIKLFAKNEYVDDYNRKCLLVFSGSIYEFVSLDSGTEKDLSGIAAPHMLWLKKGCPVVLLRNVTDLLVNGLRGTVYDIDDGGPLINFPSINVTTRISKVKFTVFSPHLNKDIAVREQYPLKLGFGLTIHKAQGMTLSSVEVDCRDIFMAGQLGVAISRVTTSAGLRILNFHHRYVIPPPKTVIEFMSEQSNALLADLGCCRYIKRSSNPSLVEQSATVHLHPVFTDENEMNVEVEVTDLEDLNDEFNHILEKIVSAEEDSIEFEIPEGFDVDSVVENVIFKKEITQSHSEINNTIKRIDRQRLLTFVKKLFLKLGKFVSTLSTDQGSVQGVPEKKLAQYYRLVHEFSTSAEYKLDCLIFLETEHAFSDNHMIVCYCILEAIRTHYLKQKVELLKITGGNVPKRHVTNASRARVRYVAGYCLATLRRKYSRKKKTNMYSKTKQGQDGYNQAKCVLNILGVLKEDEHFLKANSDEPESLVDIDRRQFVSHGLTNVSDSLFHFFISLTDKILGLLLYENLMKYGKDMMSKCLDKVMKDQDLYENFVKVAGTAVSNRTS